MAVVQHTRQFIHTHTFSLVPKTCCYELRPRPVNTRYQDELDADAERGHVEDFIDLFPEKPLRVAMYSRPHALELVEGTGWEVESLNDPEEHIQHYMICRPV